MDLLNQSPDCYEQFIVKLNIIPSNLKYRFSVFNEYVFVFKASKDESESYGKISIEIVPESKFKIFDDIVGRSKKLELNENSFNGIESISIGSDEFQMEIIKNESDFDTKYIAVLKNQPDSQQVKDKYVWLLSHNRGRIGKLEYEPFYYLSPTFQLKVCDLKADQIKSEIGKNIQTVKDLGGTIHTKEDVISGLEKLTTQQSIGECLRANLQKSDC